MGQQARSAVPGIAIRRYERSDLDAVIEIFQRAVREVAAKDYSPEQIAVWSAVDRAEWDEWRLHCPAWIAEVGGRPGGFTDLEPDGHLDMMFVHPDFQRIGVASRLLATVEEAARSLSLDRIYAEASITAWPFFERRGFRILGKHDKTKDGFPFTIFDVEKPVACLPSG